MQKTEHYQLNQWEKTDRILMEDFNADNTKIAAALAENKRAIEATEASCSSAIEAVAAAAGNCKVITGTYTGSGTYNKADTAVKLAFPARPALLLIAGGSAWAVIANMYTGHTFSGTDSLRSLAVCYDEDTGIGYWLSSGSQQSQMNMSSATYTYFAFYL